MTVRKPCPEAPGPREAYARGFDACFGTLAQRRAFRAYLQGLLLPRERNKTLTALAGTEPLVGAQHPAAQHLQYFLSEAAWDGAAVDARRLAGLLVDPATRPHAQGVLVLDDTGDRKDGTQTAHVARQYLGIIGKVDNGIVAVTSLWADARVYSPLHVEPYTPRRASPGGAGTPPSGPSPPSPWSWSPPRRRRGCPSGWWWPTASPGTTSSSRRPCTGRGCPTCWASSRRRGCGCARTPPPCWRRR